MSTNQPAKIILKAMLVKEIRYKNTAAYKHFFKEFSAEKLLTYLHTEDPVKFSIFKCDVCNPDGTNNNTCSDILCAGGDPNSYVDNLLDYMGVTNYICLQAVQNQKNGNFFDFYVEDTRKFNSIYAKNINPQIIVLFVGSRDLFVNHFKNPTKNDTKSRSGRYRSNSKHRIMHDITLDKTIQYNNNTYVLDSMHLDNYNQDSKYQVDNNKYPISCHAISYITCNHKLFVYNGWITENKKKPCPLRKMNWLDLAQYPYSFDHTTCDIIHDTNDYNVNEVLIEDTSKFRNKFTQDDRRIYFYVLKEPKKYHFEWGSLYDNIDSIKLFKKNDTKPNIILIRNRTKSDIDQQINSLTRELFDRNLMHIRLDISNVLTNHFERRIRRNLSSVNSPTNSSKSNASKNSAISNSYVVSMKDPTRI
jgi:hypothetical protein